MSRVISWPVKCAPARWDKADSGMCVIAGEVLFADVLLLPNGMSKVGANA